MKLLPTLILFLLVSCSEVSETEELHLFSVDGMDAFEIIGFDKETVHFDGIQHPNPQELTGATLFMNSDQVIIENKDRSIAYSCSYQQPIDTVYKGIEENIIWFIFNEDLDIEMFMDFTDCIVPPEDPAVAKIYCIYEACNNELRHVAVLGNIGFFNYKGKRFFIVKRSN